MGWSTTAMAARYQHLTDPIRRSVAERVDSLLWDPDVPPESGANGLAADQAGGRE
jgi:integrase